MLGSISGRDAMQQSIANTFGFLQELRQTTRDVQKKNNRADRAAVGLNSKQACVLLRMVADVSSVNPHAVLAARRLLPGAVFLGTDTLDEQETRLRLLIDRHRVHVAAAETWAVVPWKRNAVRAVRIVAELRLLKRISELNSRGVTPNSAMMAEMLVQEWPVHMLQPAIVAWLARLPVDLRLRRRWLVKFRRFWNVGYRQLGSRGHLSPGDQRRKVRSKSYHLNIIFGSGFDPKTGDSFRRHIWVRESMFLFFRRDTSCNHFGPGYGVKTWSECITAIREAALMLQWAEWLRKCVLGGRETIFVNLDETPMAKQMKARRGYVCEVIGTVASDWHARITTRDSRSHATLMAAVCDDAELQRHLPQLLLTKDETLTRAEKTALAALPLPIRWLRGTSGWMTSALCKQVFTIYRRAIRAVRPNADIVMVFDVASQHVTRDVLMHLNRLNMHTLLIPAGMTWLLQPLDTHVFSTLKRSLHDLQSRGRGESPLGILPACSWIRIAGAAIKDVLVDRDWTHSLRGNGLHSQVVPLRPTLANFFHEVFPLPPFPLSSAQMKDLLNRPTMERRDACLRYSMRLLEHPLPGPALPAVRMLFPRLVRLPGRAPVASAEAVATEVAAASASGSGGPAPPAPDAALRRTRSGGLY